MICLAATIDKKCWAPISYWLCNWYNSKEECWGNSKLEKPCIPMMMSWKKTKWHMTLFLWACKTCLQPCHHTINTLCGPSDGERSTQTTWHTLHQDPHPSCGNCILNLEDSTSQFWHSGRGYPCPGSRPPFGLKHSQRGSSLRSELPYKWPPYPIVPEIQSCHMLCGTGHCPGYA